MKNSKIMMNKKSSVTIVLILVAMLWICNSSVHAQEPVAGIQPRGALCLDCNIGEMKTVYGSWGEWYFDEEVKCTHGYPYGTDKILVRNRLITYICTACGAGYQNTGAEKKAECHGYY